MRHGSPQTTDLVANIRQNVHHHQRPVASVSIVCIFNKIHFLNTSAAALPATAAIHDQTPGGNPQPPRCGSLTPSSCINKMESLKSVSYFKHRARLQMISMFSQLPAFEVHDTGGPSTPRSLNPRVLVERCPLGSGPSSRSGMPGHGSSWGNPNAPTNLQVPTVHIIHTISIPQESGKSWG